MTHVVSTKANRLYKLWASVLASLSIGTVLVYSSEITTHKVKQNKVSLGKLLANELDVNIDLVADDLYITRTAEGTVIENDHNGFIVKESPSGSIILCGDDGSEILRYQKAEVLAGLIGMAIIQGDGNFHADGSEDDEPGVSCPEGECPYMGYCIECDDESGDIGDPGDTEDTGGTGGSSECPSCHGPGTK